MWALCAASACSNTPTATSDNPPSVNTGGFGITGGSVTGGIPATGGLSGSGGIGIGATGGSVATGGTGATGGVASGGGSGAETGGASDMCPAATQCQLVFGAACTLEPVAAGTPCDDGDPSTSGDRCDGAGQCVGSGGTGGVASGGNTNTGTGGMSTGGTPGPDVDCPPNFTTVASPLSSPPYGGTSFISSDLLQASDPSSFVDLTYDGQGTRTVFDRRTNNFESRTVHLFSVIFGQQTRRTVEFRVNTEFSQTEAEAHVRDYGHTVGQLPAFLLRDVGEVTIHAGVEPFGGGNGGLLIHTGQGENYKSSGDLEEILIHESAHTSVDADHREAAGWVAAQQADGVAISTYGRDNPTREDIAETIGAYLPFRYGGDRVPQDVKDTIGGAVPNRILYFDCLGFSMERLP